MSPPKPSASRDPLEGAKAPAFSLPASGGGTVALKDFAGRRVLLYFYPKDQTPGCTTEACDFREAWDALQRHGVEVLGISPDDVDSHERFVAKERLNFRLLADPDHRVAEGYGAWGEKQNYGKTYQGIIRSTFLIGADGRVEKAWRNVKAAGHVAKVREYLAG